MDLELEGPIGSSSYKEKRYDLNDYHKSFSGDRYISSTKYAKGTINKKDRFNIYLDPSKFEVGKYLVTVSVYDSGSGLNSRKRLDNSRWTFTIISQDKKEETPQQYPRTNEYWDAETSSKASCTPNTAKANCDSLYSCVSCGGSCYPQGVHKFGDDTLACAKGKWKLVPKTKSENSQDKKVETPQQYPRTNEYWDAETSNKASCAPNSAKANCDSSRSCVSCGNVCYNEGLHKIGDDLVACADGKWKIVPMPASEKSQDKEEEAPKEFSKTNEYWDSRMAGCEPGSVEAMCNSPNSCVDCDGKCYSEGPYRTAICVEGKWKSTSEEVPSREEEPARSDACPDGCRRDLDGYCVCPTTDDEVPANSEICPPDCGIVISTGECVCPTDTAVETPVNEDSAVERQSI